MYIYFSIDIGFSNFILHCNNGIPSPVTSRMKLNSRIDGLVWLEPISVLAELGCLERGLEK